MKRLNTQGLNTRSLNTQRLKTQRLNLAGLLIVIGLLTGISVAQTESLADAARKQKQQNSGKPVAAKVFTNDDLPRAETINTVGAAPVEQAPVHVAGEVGNQTGSEQPMHTAPPQSAPGPEGAPAKDAAATDKSKDSTKDKTEDAAKDKKKTWEDWRGKIEKQREAVDRMQKENDELDRQFKLTTGNYYNSAQQRIYDGAAMAKEDAAYKEQLEAKKKALDDAKQKVDDLQEEARRAGVPSGYRD